MNVNDVSSIAQLATITDAQAARMLSEPAAADLADRIMAVQLTGSVRVIRRRRWLAWAPAAGVLGAAAVAVAVVVALGTGSGPGKPVIYAQPLAFTRHGGYINVIVRNPLADPARYRAEFRAHGLDITLKLVPASPSIVGTVVYFDGNRAIKVITAKGRCYTGGGGSDCPVGVRIPMNFHGSADLVFGRAARPGERYDSTAPATAPGEALHGLKIQGRRVSAVLAMIARRHVTAAVFHLTTASGVGELRKPGQVPHTWWVYGADPWAPGQVMLWVGAHRHQRIPEPSGPGNPTATPAPSVTGPGNPRATPAPSVTGPGNPRATPVPSVSGPGNPRATPVPSVSGPGNPTPTPSG